MSSKNFMAYGDAESVLAGYANRINLKPSTFTGTIAQWNALSVAEKAKYTIVNLTDDGETGDVVDEIQNGNMNPITSNAVYGASIKTYTVTADGVMTNEQVLNSMYATINQLFNAGCILHGIMIDSKSSAATKVFLPFELWETPLFGFTGVHLSLTQVQIRAVVIKESGSSRREDVISISSGTHSFTNRSDEIPTNGATFTLYYT